MARVTCVCCNRTYDDTYRDTGCPHNTFNMHTMIGGQIRSDNEQQPKEYVEFVATTVEDLQEIQDYISGRTPTNTAAIERIISSHHVHTQRDGYVRCDSPSISGVLVETS